MSNRNKRLRLWKEDSHCFVCDEIILDFEDSTIEHIIPLAAGGANRNYNIAISHRICNEIKADYILREEWRRRIIDYKNIQDKKIWSTKRSDYLVKLLLRNSFSDSETILKSLKKLRCCQPDDTPRIDLKSQLHKIKILRKLASVNELIETSRILDVFGTKKYWKIIFGILFIDSFFKTNNVQALLHAIWRLDSLSGNEPSLILHLYAKDLLALCKELDPLAFQKFEELKDQWTKAKKISA